MKVIFESGGAAAGLQPPGTRKSSAIFYFRDSWRGPNGYSKEGDTPPWAFAPLSKWWAAYNGFRP